MAHAVSLTYARFDHISPTAVAMTTLLHVAVAAALWWVSPLRPVDPYEDAIAITMEPVKPPDQPTPPQSPPVLPEPPPPPQAANPPSPPPAPPVRWGLAPVQPKPDTSDVTGVPNPAPAQPETPAQETTRPDPPKPEDTSTEPQQQALAVPPPPPPPPPPPQPTLEAALPPLEAPPPPLTSREIPRPPPPAAKPPPPPPPQPAQRPPPPRPALTAPAPQSSPLSHPPPQRAPADQQASRQAPAFQNPADIYGHRQAESEYLWFIARKVSQHQQFVGSATTESGTVELRLTIARSGQLVNVVVSRSSGIASLDNASVSIVRGAGPYAPLPPDIAGPEHTFTLPLYYRRN